MVQGSHVQFIRYIREEIFIRRLNVGLKSDNALYCGTLVPADHCANVNESADDTLALKII